jgi:hypothetical protein
MDSTSATHLIFETVPQIFESETGPHRVLLQVEGENYPLHSLIPLSPELKEYLEICSAIWDDLKPMTDGKLTQVIERQWIQQKYAIAWLEARTRIKQWPLIIDYARRLRLRTIENQSVSKTFVIELDLADENAPRLSDEHYFKVFDWLGSNNLTYFRVDETLQIKALEAISLTDVDELQSYRFYPDFLHPILDTIKGTDAVVFHINSQGDILIANRDGILASNRNDRWTVFDVDHLIGSVAQILDEKLGPVIAQNDPTCVACSIFQILFDVSFKRHGGLIVIADPATMPEFVIKGIERSPNSPLNTIFTHQAFDGLEYSVSEVRKLVELSSVDGALVLDGRGNLVQVGSMIVTHPLAQNAFGARDTAAYSAAKYGATSFKVSADGAVSILFTLQAFPDGQVHRLDLI